MVLHRARREMFDLHGRRRDGLSERRRDAATKDRLEQTDGLGFERGSAPLVVSLRAGRLFHVGLINYSTGFWRLANRT